MNTGCGGVAFGPSHRACLAEPAPAWGRFCPSHTQCYCWGTEAGEAQLGGGPPPCSPVGLGGGGTPPRPRPAVAPHLCSNSGLQLAAPPPEYTVVFLLRVLPETPRESFALWQMTAEDFQPVLGVLLDGQSTGRVVGPGPWVLRRSASGPGWGHPRLSERRPQLGPLRLGVHLHAARPWGRPVLLWGSHVLPPLPCSWQEVSDLLQPRPQGHLARGHL